MAQASDYLENKILDHVLRNTAYTSPTTVYMALYTATPNDAGGGTEVSGGGYARQDITFSAAASGTISNSSDISFVASGASFGTVTHWGIFDASTSGNLLVYGALGASQLVDDGDTYVVSSGNLNISQG